MEKVLTASNCQALFRALLLVGLTIPVTESKVLSCEYELLHRSFVVLRIQMLK